MEKVVGIGGVFFKSRQPDKLADWYKQHLGLDIEASFGGAIFGPTGQTIWSLFPTSSEYLGAKPFMLNYRVADLDAMLAQLKAAGVNVDEKTESNEFGKFGWATDIEGNRFELWQPPP